jgi:hypothetical protein
MSSTAPIYQTYLDAAEITEPIKKTSCPINSTVQFVVCTQQRLNICPPAAFDFHCLRSADYVRLRDTHEFSDVTEYATSRDYEYVAWCVAYERQAERVSERQAERVSERQAERVSERQAAEC